MTRLAHIFLASTIVSVTAAVLLYFALIQEAQRGSELSRQSYKNGLIDGAAYITGQIIKAQIEREIIEEREALAKEKL